MIELLHDDDETPVEDVEITPLNAGELSGVVEIRVWNSRGEPGGQAAQNVLLLLRTGDPEDPGVYRASGLPPQDELWGRFRIVGQVNASDPSWVLHPTGWRVAGAYAGLLIGRIPPDCAARVEFAVQPPGTAQALTWPWQIVTLSAEYSLPLPPSLARLGAGVLTELGAPGVAGIVSGCAVVPSGPADDEIHVAPGLVAIAGGLAGFITGDVQLDQDDAAAAALAPGESYKAVITRGPSGATATKGAKGALPVQPAAPSGEAFLAVVTVHYQAGGTSEIEAADIDTSAAARLRFQAIAGSGPEVLISSGQMIAGETWRFRDGWTPVPVEDDDTSYIWVLTSGLLDATLTPDPPEEWAELIWEADVAGGVVTALRDRRRYAGRTVILSPRSAPPGAAPVLVDDLMVGHERLVLEAVTLRASDNGGGSAGETVADLELNGATVFVDQATEDLRPSVAFDAGATELQHTSPAHQLTELRRGDVLTFVLADEPTGGTPARVELSLLCREP